MSHLNAVFDVHHSLWWNLSSASIDLVIFLFLPLSSFFNMFADLVNLFLSQSFME